MSTAARETRVGEIAEVLRAAQLLISGERGHAAEQEVLALLCAMTGASRVTLRTGDTGHTAECIAGSTQPVPAPHVVRLTLPLRYADDDLGVLTISAPVCLTVAQEQAATLIADLLSLHLIAQRRTQQLSAAAAERRRIAARFIEATEREHDELAGQLHDGPLQSLVAARYVTDMAGLAVRDGSFDEAREGVQAGLVHARRALWQLRPHAADGQDLPGALGNLARQLEDYIGLRVDVTCFGVPQVLPPAVASAGFRVAQEMLCAGVRDRAASRASVSATVEGNVLVLLVTDDGVGQVVEVPAGLARWREWVALLGGDVRLRGKRGGGAWLQARLPLSDEDIERTVTQ